MSTFHSFSQYIGVRKGVKADRQILHIQIKVCDQNWDESCFWHTGRCFLTVLPPSLYFLWTQPVEKLNYQGVMLDTSILCGRIFFSEPCALLVRLVMLEIKATLCCYPPWASVAVVPKSILASRWPERGEEQTTWRTVRCVLGVMGNVTSVNNNLGPVL